jgi:hypothetical protein
MHKDSKDASANESIQCVLMILNILDGQDSTHEYQEAHAHKQMSVQLSYHIVFTKGLNVTAFSHHHASLAYACHSASDQIFT